VIDVLDRRVFVLGLAVLLAGCAPRQMEDTGAGLVSDPATPGPAPPAPPAPPATGEAQAAADLFGAIERRRSVRAFAADPVSGEHIALMMRSAQGITDPASGFRAAPSAGALYPLELYAAAADGVYRYSPADDELRRLNDNDVRRVLALAALAQMFIAEAPVVFVVNAVYARTAAKYGERAERYVHLEAGHAAQNLMLTAVHLGLGSVAIGAFVDEGVRRAIAAGNDETPLYLIPVGTPER